MKIMAHEDDCEIVKTGPSYYVSDELASGYISTACTCGGVIVEIEPNTPGLVARLTLPKKDD